jgi:hypothetical protein
MFKFYLPVYPTGSTVGTLLCQDVPQENCPDHGPGQAIEVALDRTHGTPNLTFHCSVVSAAVYARDRAFLG